MSSVCYHDYLQLKPSTIWLWKGLLPCSGTALLYAHAKTGKSKLALSLCDAIVDLECQQYLGQPLHQHGPCLYLQFDTPRGVWIEKYLECLTIRPALHQLHLIDREMANVPFPMDIRMPIHLDWLKRECEHLQPVLVVIDTIRRCHRGKENDSDVMDAVLDALIVATRPASLLILAHKTKFQPGQGGETARGSSALMGAVDALLNLTKTGLHIEARSDVPEELALTQDISGLWRLDESKSEHEQFIAEFTGTPAQLNQALIQHFHISESTAKRWRKSLKR